MSVHRLVFAVCLVTNLILLGSGRVYAIVSGPYTADSNTLHLWHITETTVPVVDSGTGGVNLTSLGTGSGNSLGNTSYPGFGNAYKGVQVAETGLLAKPFATGGTDDTPVTTFWNQSTGAFTYEMILRVDFDPVAAANGFEPNLITFENDNGGGGRVFQWNLTKTAGAYNLNFTNIAAGTSTSNALTVTQGHWYHAAVAYNGAAVNNMTFYWTDMGTDALPDGSATVAASAGTATMGSSLSANGATAADWAIGSEGRSTGGNTGQWAGLIDEVRVSDIARTSGQFIFSVPEPSAYILFGIGITGLGWLRMRKRN
jgi:hypothetical protein